MTEEEKTQQANEARTLRQEHILQAVIRQIVKDETNHGDYASTHELAGVLREEYDEFWDEVKGNNAPAMVAELIQVAAVAIRGAARFMGMVPMRATAAEEANAARWMLWYGLRSVPTETRGAALERAGLLHMVTEAEEFLADYSKGFSENGAKRWALGFLEIVGPSFPSDRRDAINQWAATLD